MKGKKQFTATEAQVIVSLIRKKVSSGKYEQKK